MKPKNHFAFAIGIFLMFTLSGAAFYSSVEGWSYIDSAYFIAATVTTIGYGDIAPTTSLGKIFTIFFSFFGVGMFLYFISLFGKYFYKKIIRKEIHRSKEDIKKDIEEGKIKVQKETKIKKKSRKK